MEIKQEKIETIGIGINCLLIFVLVPILGFSLAGFFGSLYPLFYSAHFSLIICSSIVIFEFIRRKSNKPEKIFKTFQIDNSKPPISLTINKIGIIISLIALIQLSLLLKDIGLNILFVCSIFVCGSNFILMAIPEQRRNTTKQQANTTKQELMETIPIIINSGFFLMFILQMFTFGKYLVIFSEFKLLLLSIMSSFIIIPILVCYETLRLIKKDVFNPIINNIAIALSVFFVIYFSINFRNMGSVSLTLICSVFYMTPLFFNLSVLFYHKKTNSLLFKSDFNEYENVEEMGYRVLGEKRILYYSLGFASFLFFVLFNISLIASLSVIVISVVLVKVRQGQLLGQSVKISKEQLPEVYETARLAAERLSMEMPDVFVRQDPVINAFALGFLGKKSVVLNSKTVEVLDKNEILSVLGHEFSHIKCGHTIWIVITNSVEGVRIPVISDILGFIFLLWSRKAEFTADRGGVLASMDLKSSISALAKIAIGGTLYKELNLEKFIDQEKEVNSDIISKLSVSLSTHPYTVKRMVALEEFFHSEKYNKLVYEDFPKQYRENTENQEKPNLENIKASDAIAVNNNSEEVIPV